MATTAAIQIIGASSLQEFESNIRLISLLTAENFGDRINLVNGIADPYTDETDIDIATSVNESYDASGDFYEGTSGTSVVGDGVGTNSGDFTLGGGLGAARNGNTSETAANSALTSSSSGDSFYQVDWGAGNDKVITQFEIWGPNDAAFFSTASGTAKLQGSANASSWNDLSAADALPTGASAQDTITATDTSTAYRYHRIVMNSGSTNVRRIAELRFTEQNPPSDLTLVSNSFTAESVPSTGRIHIQIRENETVTVNTDFTAEVSRDNGTTWTLGTLVKVADLADSTVAYEDSDVDISGQPTGTSMKYRIKTLNNKDIEIHGTILQWS